MKIKLDSIEALAKAHHELGHHFKKMAAHHDALHKAHTEHAAFIKGTHDAMADDDVQKAHFGKMAAHHDAIASLHKAASEHYGTMADEHGDKAMEDKLGKEAGTGASGSDVGAAPANIGEFLQKSVTDVMTDLGKTDDFKKVIRDYVMNAVKEQLGQTLVPTNVKAVGTITQDPKNLLLVPRPASLEKSGNKEQDEFPSELAHFAEG